jgi:hypothetical protein
MAILVSRYKRVYGVKGQLTSDVVGGGELGQSTIWADVATFEELPNDNLRNGDLCTVTADNYTYRYNDDINVWEISIVRESDFTNFPTDDLYEFAIGYVLINGDEEYLNPYFFDFGKETWTRYIIDSSIGWNTNEPEFYTDFTDLPDGSDGAQENDKVLVNPGDDNLYYLTMADGFVWNLDIGYFNTFAEMNAYSESTIGEASRAYVVSGLNSGIAHKIPYIRNSVNDGWDRVPYNVNYYYFYYPVENYGDLSNDLDDIRDGDMRILQSNDLNFTAIFIYDSNADEWKILVGISYTKAAFDPSSTEYAGDLGSTLILLAKDDFSPGWSSDEIVGSFFKAFPNIWVRAFSGIPYKWTDLPNITDLVNIETNAVGWILADDEISIDNLGYANSYGIIKVVELSPTPEYILVSAYFDTVDDMNAFSTTEATTYNIIIDSNSIIEVG